MDEVRRNQDESGEKMKAVIIAIICLSSLTVIAADPVAIGSRRELFVDRFLIDKLTNARLHLCEPRDEGIVLRMDRPWEGPQSGYSTVLRDGERDGEGLGHPR